MIIDHHDLGKTSIKDGIMINDNKVSSTCEMVTNLIEYYDVEIDSYYATILLSYKSRIELKYNFCLVPMTLNSVTSVNHFSFG